MTGTTLVVLAPDAIPEVARGTDLATLVADAVELLPGDVVVVTSKVVSKAEGRVVAGGADSYARALASETLRVVASRGPVQIVRQRLGLVMAAAGIDRSNVSTGNLVLLPEDPDSSARELRSRLRALTGVNVGVVITDTSGRAWREGQTDIAIGVAGLVPLEQFAGRHDSYGNELSVTMPAVADEIAGAAELAQGKLGGRPVAVVRGRQDLVLAPEEDGPGAVALVRPEGGDLFGYGSREAVLAALAQAPGTASVFGSPVSAEELLHAVRRVLPGVTAERTAERTVERQAPGADACTGLDLALPPGAAREVLAALCFSHGWRIALWQADVAHPDAVVARVSPDIP
ncbi:coenzyme F420-0:L-glutamate ligase [Nocardioides houyundeii]|uniref:coenzyme F420-0:L-glutamate ligase n=1 Tax=Nocardioides houyundeii TaxID=2045452 RepID=UPI000C779E20|nr:coenzyme F420-0:L-glutamate ligase [Nocardioides houyundeii]